MILITNLTQSLGGVEFQIDSVNNKGQYSIDGGSTWQNFSSGVTSGSEACNPSKIESHSVNLGFRPKMLMLGIVMDASAPYMWMVYDESVSTTKYRVPATSSPYSSLRDFVSGSGSVSGIVQITNTGFDYRAVYDKLIWYFAC